MTHNRIRASHSDVRRLLSYDAATGVLSRSVGRQGTVAGKAMGCAAPNGYLRAKFLGQPLPVHRLIWFYIYGEDTDLQIDHIDGDPANNRISNLRLATPSQNSTNRKRFSTNKTGFKGVSFSPPTKTYVAKFWNGGKIIYCGYFKTPEEAAEAYRRKAREMNGEFYSDGERAP